ncbi:leucyl/phenylalanyl-tRNA--protein transferase [Erythrobacter sp. SCSIO 43205]|uniref:leucyl/phenylalanyl-tRNA--protein transferase n=1 Tax=Erythrobacter sp. SCSIO 43205 TaxID=2779361 RepID=UPI001CA7F7A7|nr:leucyl/phenylalanyl-tRNA--protein transferase [Erythrobacter sp. SCSIO 43205]UAB79639.1 leucyl/phenylalanyl-tRNA--protein transferase [Erythrobacter sp. SCSIO 43205]
MHSPHHPDQKAPIPVETLLLAYRSGIFPMADNREDDEIFWVEPRERAIIPLEGLHVSKSLRKVLRSDRYHVTMDRDFEGVMHACAAPRPGHPESWISGRIVDSYTGLHRAGYAHSIECWDTQDDAPPRLVGGLYGVSFNRVFCGESMFSRADNASKVALCWLVACLNRAGYKVLDCQFMTDHLASMGAVEMPQKAYLKLVDGAQGMPQATLAQAFESFVNPASAGVDYSSPASSSEGTEGASSGGSPGKRIAQSLTQTS